MSEKTTTAADKKAPPPAPKPEPKPKSVTFVATAPQKRVYNDRGDLAVRFSDGEFSTSDEALVALLDAASGVRRAD